MMIAIRGGEQGLHRYTHGAESRADSPARCVSIDMMSSTLLNWGRQPESGWDTRGAGGGEGCGVCT